MSKLEKIIRREKRFIDLAKHQELYCEHHQSFLTPYEVMTKRCYTGYKGKRFCKYVRFI
jgi:methionyl-tRNA synthetase